MQSEIRSVKNQNRAPAAAGATSENKKKKKKMPRHTRARELREFPREADAFRGQSRARDARSRANRERNLTRAREHFL